MEKYEKIIANTKTLKEIDAFIANAQRLGKDELLSIAFARRAEFARADYESTGRRPNINYLEIGLSIGDIITHMLTGEKAIIRTDRTLTFRCFEEHITNIEKVLFTEMERDESPAPRKYSKTTWMTDDGKTLDELYLKTYGAKR